MILELILITAIYLLGVGYNALQKVGNIRAKYPGLSFKTVWVSYFNEEWNTLMVSGLGLLTVQIFWFISHTKNIPLPHWLHEWGIYLFDLFLGYALHRIIYRYMGTMEKVIDEKFGK